MRHSRLSPVSSWRWVATPVSQSVVATARSSSATSSSGRPSNRAAKASLEDRGGGEHRPLGGGPERRRDREPGTDAGHAHAARQDHGGAGQRTQGGRLHEFEVGELRHLRGVGHEAGARAAATW